MRGIIPVLWVTTKVTDETNITAHIPVTLILGIKYIDFQDQHILVSHLYILCSCPDFGVGSLYIIWDYIAVSEKSRCTKAFSQKRGTFTFLSIFILVKSGVLVYYLLPSLFTMELLKRFFLLGMDIFYQFWFPNEIIARSWNKWRINIIGWIV